MITVKFNLTDEQLDKLASIQLRENPKKKWTRTEQIKLSRETIEKIVMNWLRQG